MADKNSRATSVDQERREFTCQFCDRVFTSKQALGGHQNSHRKERDAVKRAKAQEVPLFPALCALRVAKFLAAVSQSDGDGDGDGKDSRTAAAADADGGQSSPQLSPKRSRRDEGDDEAAELDLTLHL